MAEHQDPQLVVTDMATVVWRNSGEPHDTTPGLLRAAAAWIEANPHVELWRVTADVREDGNGGFACELHVLVDAGVDASGFELVETGPVNSDTYVTLPLHQRAQAEAIAGLLRSSTVGAYRGSRTDALTDAVGIVLAARFAPPLGDNHHNAGACPYCTPAAPAAHG